MTGALTDDLGNAGQKQKNNEQIALMMDTKLHETRITVNIKSL